MMRISRQLLPASVLTLALLAPGRAHATDNAAAAEVLFNEAKQLREAGKLDQACPKFLASYKLDRTLGTLMNLADCREQIGQIASAWADWSEAVELATKQQDARADFAKSRRDALAPRLPKLKVEIDKPVAGLDVYRGDTKLEPGAYNLALPVDPGNQVLEVRRGSRVLEQKWFDAKEQQEGSVSFDLAALDKKFPPPKDSGPGGGRAGPTEPVDSTQKTIGYVVGGAGVLGLLVGGGFTVMSLVKKSEADESDACVQKFCTNKGLDAADDAKTYANVAQWVGIGGVLLTAVGATLIFTAPSAERQAKRRRLVASPWIGAGAGGVMVGGQL